MVLLMTRLAVAFATFAPLQSVETEPDSALHMRPHSGGISLRPVSDEASQKIVECEVRLNTLGKKIHVRWSASAGHGFKGKVVIEENVVPYFPTALCRSHDNPRSFYVVGRSGVGLRLEKWTIDDSVSVVGIQSSGKASSFFTPPKVHRAQLEISPTLDDMCDMTVNPWPPPDGQGNEELWVMEYSSRNVYSVDLETGLLTLRLASTEVGEYRKVWINRHSVYGLCMLFSRTPTGINPVQAPSEPDNLIKYDRDLDGVFDGTFIMPFGGDGFSQHPIQANGEWVEIWPDYN